MSILKNVALPDFGKPDIMPPLAPSQHEARLQTVCEKMQAENVDVLVVYGDREHCANLAYLTGFDPRFEEALLLLDSGGKRNLLVGNECLGYLPAWWPSAQVELYQEFSLLGQPRDQSRSLHTIFESFGVGRGVKIGCVGWKYFEDDAFEDAGRVLEIPSFIADAVRSLSGDASLVTNRTSWFMNPRDGFRLHNSPAQIAQFEYASAHCSSGVLAALRNLRVGTRESDLEHFLDSAGVPLSCHRMIGFGDKARQGLASPSQNRAELGDPYTLCMGVWGNLTSRAGAVAHNAGDLPAAIRDFYSRFVSNYFEVVATWYAHVRVGVTGGEVFEAVEAARDKELYNFALNPGHYLHLDEWVNSPFYQGSDITLPSGAALQMDIIPVSKGPFCYVNCEDGIVLADGSLRERIAMEHPEVWSRIQKRRAFMAKVLGFSLDESVLPLSNIPGWLPPYALELDKVMVIG